MFALITDHKQRRIEEGIESVREREHKLKWTSMYELPFDFVGSHYERHMILGICFIVCVCVRHNFLRTC